MKGKFMKNIGYLIVLIDIAIYFVLSYVRVDGLQDNLFAVFVNGILLFIGAFIANSAMTKQGLLNGGDAEKYKATVTAHIEQKKKILPKFKYLQAWLDQDYYKLLKIGRMIYVNSAGYEYSKVFDEQGKLEEGFRVEKPKKVGKHRLWHFLFGDEWKIYRERKKFIKKAKRYNITRLTVTDVTMLENDADPNNFGIGEAKYEVRRGGVKLLSQLVFSCLLPTISWFYIGLNKQTLITQIINIILILMTALWSMYSAYTFKVKTYRNTIIKKINKLEEFDNSDLKELKDDIRQKESLSTQGSLVEKVYGDSELKQENNLCGE